MTYSQIIEERDGYRVSIINDEYAGKPDSDGQAYVLQLDGSRAESMTNGAKGDSFADAYNHLAEWFDTHKALEAFERYLRIFHGTKSFEAEHIGRVREFGYIAFDTAAVRTEWGLTDEYLAAHPDVFPNDGADIAAGTLSEWWAWASGDVWGYQVERQVSYVKTYAEDDIDDEDGDEWVEVEDGECWGYYGQEWAEQAAREALEAELPVNGTTGH